MAANRPRWFAPVYRFLGSWYLPAALLVLLVLLVFLWALPRRTESILSAESDLQVMLAGVQQTRASSILEARPATLCLSDRAGRCLRGNVPAPAWNAFLERDGETRTLAQRVLPAGIEIRASRARLDFWPYAMAASTNTLTICDTQGLGRPRALVVSQTGRVRVEDADREACGA